MTKMGNIQLINLPPVAYVIAENKPNGWVLANVREGGLDRELRTIDPAHEQNGERIRLRWA